METLRRYWGYDSFRPRQENVIRSLLAGRDTCVVMPTGGGKSLCYQLPAVISGKTTIVVSPLIALMQDQAAQLAQMGIPAAAVNSFQTASEYSKVMVNAKRGDYRLIYLSPERLARPDTFDWLSQVPVGFFAVDEAHCISEWGHEFRPDYRQLSRLRTSFPQIPIAGFTASATKQVRHDILKQLQLRDPDLYIASFHRENLRYITRETDSQTQLDLLLRGLRHYTEGSVIVYAPTIARVQETVERLEDEGIAAIPYHAKMEASLRRQNQERWMSDEVRVLVGTIAFGLGINKPGVRAVIHLSLPKSIEQYYQEAGRAGRDGRQADCVLLWQKRDHILLEYFIKQISDEAERERSWDRKRVMSRFVDSPGCRHRQICVHFGETPKWERCGTCDNCGAEPEWLTEKSTPLRVPARPQKKRIVRPRPEPDIFGEPVPPALYDPALADNLREWRRDKSREQKVPAYVVLHDSTLEELCRQRPSSIAALRHIPGIGERKAEVYGGEILQVLREFDGGKRAAAPAGKEQSAAEQTLALLSQGASFEEIARARDRQVSTIVCTVANLVESGRVELQPEWISPGAQPHIEEACGRVGVERLADIKAAVPLFVSYDDVRLVVAHLRARRRLEEKSA